MNEHGFRKLVSGQSKGLKAIALRFLLKTAALLYRLVIGVRNLLYDKKLLKAHSVKVPVISVGNITTGGTGKTPLVVWICRYLAEKKIRCVVLTRGYKTKKGKFSDEPAVITRSCPQAKIVVDADRVEGAKKAIEALDAQSLVMDDGYQHRRLARDLNIVTIDSTEPFGFGRMLPAGLLREPLKQLRRAHAAVITRCDQTHPEHVDAIEQKLATINPQMLIARSVHSPVCAKCMKNKEISLDQLKEMKLYAFCGIGNPESFFVTLKKLGLNVAGSKIYNDHHNYTTTDINNIYEEARHLEADIVITTQKDWTKTVLTASNKNEISLTYLDIELKFISGKEKISRLIEEAISSKLSKTQQIQG